MENMEVIEALGRISEIEDELTEMSKKFKFEYDINVYEINTLDNQFANTVRIQVRKRLR